MFDMIGGTSTGGLIAIMLGRLRMSIEECKKAYTDLSKIAFTKRNIVSRAIGKVTVGPQFKTTPLETAIKSILGDGWETTLLKDSRNKCRTFVVAHLQDIDEHAILRSYRNTSKSKASLDDMHIWQACRATSAAVTFFEPITVDGSIYSDGGLMYNNPVQLVHGEASEMFPGRTQMIISLGTGIGKNTKFDPSLTTIALQLAKIATETERTADEFYRRDGAKAANAGLYFRFNVPGLGDTGLEESEKLHEIRLLTEKYIDNSEVGRKVGSCAEQLAVYDRNAVPILEPIFGALSLGTDEVLPAILSWLSKAEFTVAEQVRILRHLAVFTGNTNASTEGLTRQIDEFGFGRSIIQFLARGSSRIDVEAEKDRLRIAIISTKLFGDNNIETTSNIHLTDGHRCKLEEAFRAKLYYNSMDTREQQGISEAHKTTFHWIFEDSGNGTTKWSSFTDWLESAEQIYWIMGKAGTGKSTLMKYLTQHIQSPNRAKGSKSSTTENRCTQYLQRWAGEQRLIMASFYFWAAGSITQKSLTGLFKTLLFQLLQAFPEAIPFTSPKRWQALCLFNEDPIELTELELRRMFKRAVQHISSKAKVVLFVDGLDEFDGPEKNSEPLISTLRDAVRSSSSVKLCVASRPETEFQEAFKGQPSLQLEHLTHSDINHYVTAKFEESENFLARRDDDPRLANKLINSVVLGASGVFLWVRVVVTSLLAGLGQADRLSDLQRRFDLLPEDMEELYESILDGMAPFYLQHATEYFSLIEACPKPPPALVFSFADEENFRDLPQSRFVEIDEKDLCNRVQNMTIRLNSRCKGLLEVVGHQHSPGAGFDHCGPTIQYLHRTVQDYINSPKTKAKFGRHLPDSYDPHLRLLYANIAFYASCNPYYCNPYSEANGRMMSKTMYHANGRMTSKTMYHAAKVHPESTQELVQGLDQLCKIFAPIDYRRSLFHCGLEGIEGAYNAITSPEVQFLCLAIESGVVEYINAKVVEGGSVLLPRISLIRIFFFEQPLHNPISDAIHRITSMFTDTTTVSYSLLHIPFIPRPGRQLLSDDKRLAVVDALLKKGAGPNQAFHYLLYGIGTVSTPWRRFIGEIVCYFLDSSPDKAQSSTLGKIARLMIDHGADVNLSNVEAALKLLPAEQTREYSLSEKARSVQKAVYSALVAMKKEKLLTQIKFSDGYQDYQGIGSVSLTYPGYPGDSLAHDITIQVLGGHLVYSAPYSDQPLLK